MKTNKTTSQAKPKTRLTKLTCDPDTIILFPDSYNEIQIHKNEDDMSLYTSPELWEIISRYAQYEELESKTGKSIEQIASEAYKAKYLPAKERKKIYREETINHYKKIVQNVCDNLFPETKWRKQDYRNIAVKLVSKLKNTGTITDDMIMDEITNAVYKENQN